MDLQLVVVRPFGGFARGDAVTDPNRIAEILNGEHATHVVRACAPETTAIAEQIGKKGD